MLSLIRYFAGNKYRTAGQANKPYAEARFRTLLLMFEPRPTGQDGCAEGDEENIQLTIDHITASKIAMAELVVIAFP